MSVKYSIAISLALLVLGACGQREEPNFLSTNTQNAERISIELSGVVHMPEWVDLESQGDEKLRAFTLKHNQAGYPKIRLSDIEDNDADFEAFPTSVWLYNARTSYDLRIDVEDYGGADSAIYGPNRSYGGSPERRGVSRIIKKGDKYHVMVKYEASARQGQPATGLGENYPTPYALGTRVFVAFNHHRSDAVRQSIHRLYMPKVHNVLSSVTGAPQLDELRHIPGDFVVAESSNIKDDSKRFRLPFFSKYADFATLTTGTQAITSTNFYMAGVLLALKFENKTSSPIYIQKIHTKSNNLAYSGYYELWKSHKDLSNNMPSITRTRPFFARADGVPGSTNRRNAVYTMDIKNELGSVYSLQSGERTAGRFYLWGGIDESSRSGNTTSIQVEYSLTPTGPTLKTKLIDISPQTSSRKFEEGKAYVITIPIKS